jgi:RND superfamily putative drug exporter
MVVFLLLRDLVLTGILLLITLLAYEATMGLTGFVFVNLLGQPALHWQVGMFAFVILMAVGQDYNLFLLSRLAEERARRPLRPAVRRALVSTGRIISSCGLITAVSLGALLLSGEGYLVQMGFALAAGTLLDTFVIRPLLLPALLLLLKRPRNAVPIPNQSKHFDVVSAGS